MHCKRIKMSTIFGVVLVVLLGITCGHATIDERDMKGKTIFGFCQSSVVDHDDRGSCVCLWLTMTVRVSNRALLAGRCGC